MIKVGQELFLGEDIGYLQVFDIKNFKITRTQWFTEIDKIYDMVAINGSHQLLLVGKRGLLKATKDEELNKCYFDEEETRSICHIAESVYLVGFKNRGLIAWNENSDERLFGI